MSDRVSVNAQLALARTRGASGMTDRVMIPLPGGRWLVLTAAAFSAALAEGSTLCVAPSVSSSNDEPLVDADQLAERFDIPVTWIEQAAREGKIPSVTFGRWRRFKASEVAAACQQRAGNGS
jgi:excisionase family DNA binding protein